jgi:hypothetical protein
MFSNFAFLSMVRAMTVDNDVPGSIPAVGGNRAFLPVITNDRSRGLRAR